MPTITIDLPDNLNVPANWDARVFFATKLYEAGFLSSDQAAQTAGMPPRVFIESVEDATPVEESNRESWFTPEERAQFRENRRRLEEEWEEYYQFLLNFPVADEEDIKRQDEVREHMRQWKLPRY